MRDSSSVLSVSTGVGGSISSIISHSGQPTEESLVASYDLFRNCAASTSVGTSSLDQSSYTLNEIDDFDFPPWLDSAATNGVVIPSPTDHQVDAMRIDTSRAQNGMLREPSSE
ncbi:hypothetical protein PENTCL1PPCAC_20150, partial [Pristionchus entomophagus]